MVNIGLTGPAGCGKNTVADYLHEHYGFVQYAFADRVRDEVQAAYNLSDQSLLRDRETKELPTEHLALINCADDGFKKVAVGTSDGVNVRTAFSPRQILQWWGTDYRRAQDPHYWIKRSHEYLRRLQSVYAYPEQRPQYFVCSDLRFCNEREFIRTHDGGNIWHIHRDSAAPVNSHVSEVGLTILEGERELWNNDTVDKLYQGIDLLFGTNARFVRCEPQLEAWCCEKSQAAGREVCPECAETSAAYQEAMAPAYYTDNAEMIDANDRERIA